MKKLYTFVFFLLISILAKAQLTGMNPNTGYVTQQNLTTTITSSGLFQQSISPSGNIYSIRLLKGASVISILDMSNFWTNACTVVDANNADCVFNIPGTADTGSYDLELVTTDLVFWGSNLQTYTLPAAFTVTPPDGYISGLIYYDTNFNGIHDTGEPGIAGQTVSINPSGAYAVTNASGIYSLPAMNGTYTISWSQSYSYAYILNSDSASYTITMNSANISGFDFGGIDGLVSLSPGTAYQGEVLNAIVVSRDLFLTGANPNGNISYSYIKNQATSFTYSITLGSYTILDTNRAQLLYTVPLNVPPGTYELNIYINNFYWHLQNALTITPAPSLLSGHIYYDSNNNGQFDTGEPAVSGQKVLLTPNNTLAISDYYGDYVLGSDLGSHTVAWTPYLGSYVISGQPSYSFTNTGNMTGLDFGLRSSLPDYTTHIYFSPAFMRCNQYVTSYITYVNRSNAVAQGTIYMIHSPNIVFGYVNPPRTSWNGDTTFWTFSNLQPMESRSIAVTMLNPGVGSSIWYDTHIDVTDGTSAIQYSESSPRFSAIVRCSFDPNDKAVTPEGVDDIMHYTLMSDSLDYLIRFQNSGNDTAFTVLIRDTMDVSLDLSTFEMIASSHSVETQIDSNRAVTFLFNNILLPDSNVDEPGSHGYIRYRIHPMAGLPDPTRVENQAFIYFDQNPAIETNITWNTLVNQIPVGLDDKIYIDNAVVFYPNPMDRTGQFIFRNDKSERMMITLTDISGKTVLNTTTTNEEYTLNKGNLASGLYFFRLMNSVTGESHAGKITIR